MTWNGTDVPPELRDLPAGRYVVEAVEDEARALSPEEEAGIEAALESYRQGRVVDANRARKIIDAALGLRGCVTGSADYRFSRAAQPVTSVKGEAGDVMELTRKRPSGATSYWKPVRALPMMRV